MTETTETTAHLYGGPLDGEVMPVPAHASALHFVEQQASYHYCPHATGQRGVDTFISDSLPFDHFAQ
jgi:hypothetical protein